MTLSHELLPYVNAAMLYANNGWTEKELRDSLKAEKLSDDQVDFVLKLTGDVMDIAFEYADSLTEIMLDEDTDLEETKANVKAFLLEKEVREEYVELIITYNVFLNSKSVAEHIIVDGRKEGLSEREIRKVIQETLKVEKSTAREIYDVAIEGLENTHDDDAKSATKPALRGILFLVIGFINYEVETGPDIIHYIAFALGLYFLVVAIGRKMK